MASFSLKMAVAQALATYLQGAVPGLTCIAGSAEPDQNMAHPSLQVIPHKHTFTPSVDQAVAGDDDVMDAVVVGSDSDVLLDLGEFEGPVELRLAAKSQAQREQYESAVLAALNADEDRPGTTPLTVPAVKFATASGVVVTVYTAQAAVHVDYEDWDEEKAWDKHRFTYLEVVAQYPLLVLRRNQDIIQQLIAEFTENLNPDPTQVPDSDIESVQVNDDGTITPL